MQHPALLRRWPDYFRPQPPLCPPPPFLFVRSFLMTKPKNAAVAYSAIMRHAVVAGERSGHARGMPRIRPAPENRKFTQIHAPKMKMMRNARILQLHIHFSAISQTLGKIGKFSKK
jgi:hypothetical protein